MQTHVPPDSPYRFAQTVSDDGLTELRTFALAMLDQPGPFAAWLHSWADTEQSRRARGDDTCRARHGFSVPNTDEWTAEDLQAGIQAAAFIAVEAEDVTLNEFCRRIVSALTASAADRILQHEG